MKKIFTLLLLTSISYSICAQRLVTEDFNYNAGNLTGLAGGNVSGGAWANISGTGVPIKVVEGSLTYSNYFTSPSANSNKIQLVNTSGSAEDAARSFTQGNTGTYYASLLFKLTTGDVSNLAANSSEFGDYFTAFSPSTNAVSYVSRIYIRQGSVANTVNFGISAINSGTTPVVWSTTNFGAGDVHLITYSYQFVAGAANDICKLWVDKSFSAVEPTPTASTVNTGTDANDVGNVTVRQNGSNSPNADIDAIIVAKTYAEVSLPLNLTSFKAAFNGKATTIKWTTENEVNVSGFSIEKSLDGVNFSQFGFVHAKNGATHTEYSLLDSKVKGGNTFYRLKQIDKDGSYKLSSIEIVKNNLAIATEVFPNPTRGNLTVHHGEAAKGATVNVMSLDGKLVKSMKVETGSTQTNLTVSELVKGNYVLVFDNGGAKSLTQFSKQ